MTRVAAVLLAAVLLAPAARAGEPQAPPAAPEGRAVIPVRGMNCGGCVGTVTEALEKVEGVKSVHVSLERKQAVVTYDAGRVDAARLAAAIDATGFKAGPPAAN